MANLYMTCQPVLDRGMNIAGYEWNFAQGGQDERATFRAGAEALAGYLCGPAGDWLLKDKLAFFAAPGDMTSKDVPEALPAKRVVLELPGRSAVSDEFLDSCRRLRTRGCTFAVDIADNPDKLPPLADVADYIRLDVARLGAQKGSDAARNLAVFDAGRELIAAGVEQANEMDLLRQAGFSYFSGSGFTHGSGNPQHKVVTPSHAIVVELINKVSKGVGVLELEATFKRDVTLSFKLLRYINSVGFGLSCQIQSIRHALTILGYKQLQRWLTLLLATAGEGSTPSALMATAIARGRLMELTGQTLVSKGEQDDLFIVGVFSLLDAILGMSMERVLETLTLSEPVTDALTSRAGVYGPFLDLALACEGRDPARVAQLAGALSLSASQVNLAHADALIWVEQLGI